jgi:CBS domain-containing protein
MTPHMTSAEPETTVRQAADLMRKRLIGSLPVLDGDRLVGIVTATDVFDALGTTATDTMSRAERQLLRSPSSSKRFGVVLSGLPSVVFQSRAASPKDAINGAVTGVERAVRRRVQRPRMKATRRGSDREPIPA